MLTPDRRPMKDKRNHHVVATAHTSTKAESFVPLSRDELEAWPHGPEQVRQTALNYLRERDALRGSEAEIERHSQTLEKANTDLRGRVAELEEALERADAANERLDHDLEAQFQRAESGERVAELLEALKGLLRQMERGSEAVRDEEWYAARAAALDASEAEGG